MPNASIFHHSSKTNELRNVQGSIKTASVSTFYSGLPVGL